MTDTAANYLYGKNPCVQQTNEVFDGKATVSIVGMLRELPDNKERLPYK